MSVGADGKITHWHAFSGKQMHESLACEVQCASDSACPADEERLSEASFGLGVGGYSTGEQRERERQRELLFEGFTAVGDTMLSHFGSSRLLETIRCSPFQIGLPEW